MRNSVAFLKRRKRHVNHGKGERSRLLGRKNEAEKFSLWKIYKQYKTVSIRKD